MTRNRLLILVPAAVVFAAIGAGITAVDSASTGRSQSTACACTTVHGGNQSTPVTVAVIVNGSGASSANVDQQTVQSDGRIRVDISIRYGDETTTISGKSAENGSLVFNVTRNGTVVNESLVVDSSENQRVVFHVDSDNDDIRITRGNTSSCPCDVNGNGILGENVFGEDDAGGGVQVSVNEDDGVEVNVSGDETRCESDEKSGNDCATACTCSSSSAELSPPPRRDSGSFETGAGVMRAVVRSSDLVGLVIPDRSTDCRDVSGSDCYGA